MGVKGNNFCATTVLELTVLKRSEIFSRLYDLDADSLQPYSAATYL